MDRLAGAAIYASYENRFVARRGDAAKYGAPIERRYIGKLCFYGDWPGFIRQRAAKGGKAAFPRIEHCGVASGEHSQEQIGHWEAQGFGACAAN